MILNSFFQTLLGIVGLCAAAAFNMWTSRINQFFFFGRTLPAAFAASADAKKVTDRYLRQVRLGSFSSLCLFSFLRVEWPHLSVSGAVVIALLWQCIAFHISFAQAHRAAGEAFEKSSVAANGTYDGEAELSHVVSASLLSPTQEPGIGIWQILLPGIAVLCVWIAAATIGRLGFTYFGDAVDAMGGSMLLGMSIGMLCASTALLFLLRFSSRYRTPMARRSTRLALLLGWISAALFTGISLIAATHHRLTPTVGRMILLTLLAFAFLQAMYAWVYKKRFVPPAVERDGDEFWRWGLYYHNAGDPALFVQSRCYPAYTLNFANIFSWPIAMVVLADFGFLFFLSLRR